MLSGAIIDILTLAVRWIPIRMEIIPTTCNGIRWWVGRDRKTLSPGWYLYIPWLGGISGHSIQPQVVETEAQAVDTSDGRGLVMSLAIHYRVHDVRKWFLAVHNFDDSLPNLIQLRLAAAVGGLTYAEFIVTDVCADLLEEAREAAEKWGVEIIELGFVTCCRAFIMHQTQTEGVSEE